MHVRRRLIDPSADIRQEFVRLFNAAKQRTGIWQFAHFNDKQMHHNTFMQLYPQLQYIDSSEYTKISKPLDDHAGILVHHYSLVIGSSHYLVKIRYVNGYNFAVKCI
jgi:hypothetical protein